MFSDEKKNFKGLFFQDVEMREAFKTYPEKVFIDAKYKLLELGLPVYLILCEDSNGQSEIIVGCLLCCEDSESMTWMMNTFKEYNNEWSKCRVVMANKDIGERDVIKNWLPNTSVFIHSSLLNEKYHVINSVFHLDSKHCL